MEKAILLNPADVSMPMFDDVIRRVTAEIAQLEADARVQDWTPHQTAMAIQDALMRISLDVRDEADKVRQPLGWFTQGRYLSHGRILCAPCALGATDLLEPIYAGWPAGERRCAHCNRWLDEVQQS